MCAPALCLPMGLISWLLNWMEKPVVGNIHLQNELKHDLTQNNGTGFDLMSRGRTPDGSRGSESTLNTSASIQKMGTKKPTNPVVQGVFIPVEDSAKEPAKGPHQSAQHRGKRRSTFYFVFAGACLRPRKLCKNGLSQPMLRLCRKWKKLNDYVVLVQEPWEWTRWTRWSMPSSDPEQLPPQIGRASCRERV